MAISIDWGTKIISVPKADLTLIQSTPVEIRELNLNTFHLNLRDLEDDEAGMPFQRTHLHNTEVTLGGINYARVVEIINDYTITFEDGQYAVNLIGANSNVGDRVNVNQVSVRSANSAGLISSADIEYGSFAGAVHLDVTTSNIGTIFPTGTPRKPVNNLSDAMLIAVHRGFSTIHVIGDATIDSGADYSDMIFVGESYDKSKLTISAASNVDRCEFYTAEIAGVLDADALLHNCLIESLDYVNGEIRECILRPPGLIKLDGDNQAILARCITECTALGGPVTIDMGGAGQELAIRDLTGSIKITNKTGPEDSSAVMSGGKIVLDLATMTNGRLKIAGIADVVDISGNPLPIGISNQGGLTLWNNAISNTSITNAVWDTTSSGAAVQSIIDGVLNEPLVDHQLIGTLGMATIRNCYSRMIVLDEENGSPGTDYPIGICSFPVDNWPDAMTLKDKYGVAIIHLHGDTTVSGVTNLNDTTIESHASLDRTLTLTSGISTQGTVFNGLIVDGYLDGRCEFNTCDILDIYGFRGHIYNSILSGEIVLEDSNYKSFIVNCKSGGGPTSWPSVNVDAAPIVIRDYYGNIEITGKTGADTIGIGFSFGLLKVADTCTNGIIKTIGQARIVEDASGLGCTVDGTDLVNVGYIADTVWAATEATQLLSDVEVIKQIETGKWEIVSNQMIFYEDDNTTEITRFNLYNKVGAPASDDIYKRVKV